MTRKSIEDEAKLLFQSAQDAAQKDDAARAMEMMCRVLALNPSDPLYLRAYGELLLSQNLLTEAARAFEQSIQADPTSPESHFYLGLTSDHLGDLGKAREFFHNAMRLDPQWDDALYNYATACQRLGATDDARTALEALVQRQPNWIAPLINLGTVLADTGKSEEAMQKWQKVLEIDPHHSRALYNCGTYFQAAGKIDEAIICYRHVLQIEPDMAKANLNIGKCYYDLQDYRQAADSYREAIRIHPDYALAWYGLAATLRIPEELDDVIECYRKVIGIEPENDRAQFNLAVALRKKERIAEAIRHCRKALEITPHFTEALVYLFQLTQHACDWAMAEQLSEQLDELTERQLHWKKKTAESPMVSLRRHDHPQKNLLVAQSWAKAIQISAMAHGDVCETGPIQKRAASAKIRIGYISNDFKDHAVAHQIRGLLAAHDRNLFEIFGYACNPNDGSYYRNRLEQCCDRFIALDRLNNVEAAQKIRSDQIDILVDLMGHTQGNHLEILAFRPAEVQVGYLGFLGSSGTDFIDYFITDEVVTPRDQYPYYSEHLVFMPHCYQANDDQMPLPRALYSRRDFQLEEDWIVLSCFNQPYKINRKLFHSWAVILKKVPQAVLWLLKQNDSVQDSLRNAAKHAGLDPDRIKFSGALRIDKHLSRLQLADIAVDTFAYNGGATTSNALWAGVPVVTLLGNHLVSRMSASALHAVGLDGLIAHSAEEYENLVIALALDREKRKMLRHNLIQQRALSPLFNTILFTRHLEQAYHTMYQRYKKGMLPTSFTVQSNIGLKSEIP